MKHIFSFILFLLLALSSLAANGRTLATTPVLTSSPSSKIGAASDPALPHAHDHILVKLRKGARPQPGLRHILGNWYRVPVGKMETPVQTMGRWAGREDVELVELDYTVKLAPPSYNRPATVPQGTGFIPNDPMFDLQWNFEKVQAPTAWERNTGSGVVVAVLDSGVSKGSDLACRTFVDEFNALTEQSGPGTAADDFGHGTHVAGTIAQCTNNDEGVAGIAYDVQLMPIKVLEMYWLLLGLQMMRCLQCTNILVLLMMF